MTTHSLAPLHRNLAALRRQRWSARWLRGISTGLLVAIAGLVILFVLDWSLFLGRLERVAALAALIGVLLYTLGRWVWPWLVTKEDELDVALLVENRQRIDSDLVAALQFETSAAPAGASAVLTRAVVERGGQLATGVDWNHAAVETAHRRPLKMLAIVVAFLTVLGLFFPGHVQTFANRLTFGSRHYPTHTTIASLRVGDVDVALWSDDDAPVYSPLGHAVTFEVVAAGVIPSRGEIRLTTLDGVNPVVIELMSSSDAPTKFVGQLPRLVEEVRFQIFLGDDWTEPRRLAAIALPVVDVSVHAEPPEYARAANVDSASEGSSRQLAVVEGSRVVLEIACRNKSLASASATIGTQTFALAPVDDKRRRWSLSPDGTPLDRVADAVRYELQVVDDDGLSLAEPIEGLIRIKSDRPPRVTAAVVTQHVLPTGKPRVAFGAVDDFGIAGLKLLCLIAREDGTTEDRSIPIPLENLPQPLVQGRYSLDLSTLNLNRGDQVRITLEGHDYRGDNSGKIGVSDPIILQVTDERGVLAAMTETDQRTARQMDLIIQRQLGLGESP